MFNQNGSLHYEKSELEKKQNPQSQAKFSS